MTFNFRIIYILILSISVGSLVNAQLSYTGMPTSEALGKGNADLTSAGISNIFTNPAALAQKPVMAATMGIQNRFSFPGVWLVNGGIAIPVGKNQLFGLSVQQLSHKTFQEQLAGLFYSRRILKNLFAAAQFDVMHQATEGYGAVYAFTFELGAVMRINKRLSTGVKMFSPIGITYAENQQIPSIFSAGLSYQPSEKISLHAAVEKHSEYPTDFKAGFEYRPIPPLAIRFGYNSRVSSFSGGLGLLIKKRLSFDLAMVHNTVVGVNPTFHLNYLLSSTH